jgi:hypothetical protein
MRIVLIILALGLIGRGEARAHDGHQADSLPPWQAATTWPDRIITTFAGDPATTLSITWRTNAVVGRTIAQIAPATPDTRFDLDAYTERAKTKQIDFDHLVTEAGVAPPEENTGIGKVHYHSITFKGLKPDTLYAWRVQGDRGNWSEWFQSRTAPVTSAPVSFVYFGDAQNGIRSHWSRVIRAANQVAPNANFFLHAGDLVMKGHSDFNWAEWFTAGGFIHARTPSVPVPGNHENISIPLAGGKGRTRVRTPLWRAQFTLPEDKDLPEAYREAVYDIRYSPDLHVFVVDSARDTFDVQARWLDRKLSESDARWKVVTMHHPYFAPEQFDRNKTDARRRAALSPVIDKHDVDLVLTGHIHTYARSSWRTELNDRAVRTLAGDPQKVRTVFVISASGAKNTDTWDQAFVDSHVGDTQGDFGAIAVDRVAGNTPMFQVIRIRDGRLHYSAHMATGTVYDAFELTKAEDGTKTLTNGEAAYGDVRLFSNTGRYREWWDLR